MKKIRKRKGLIAMLSVILILIVVWLFGRYGWKLAGFGACDNSGINYIAVSENEVEIKGFYAGSFPEGCIGYISKFKNGNLYIGVKYDPIFGCFEDGEFDAIIPIKDKVKKIYLKTSNKEELIWDEQIDSAEKTKGFFR